ncbi:MAG: hypothetical protein SNJ79_09055 [Sphingomonadaceae bacterium]
MSDAGAASRAASAGPSLHPGQLDHLGKAVLLLARELWVTRDRVHVLEAVLAGRGIDVRDAVANFQPDAALAARLEQERTAFVTALLATLAPETDA